MVKLCKYSWPTALVYSCVFRLLDVRSSVQLFFDKHCTHLAQIYATLCLSLGDQSQQITACRADCGQKKAPGTYFATDGPKTQGFPNWLMFCLFICICTCVPCIFVRYRICTLPLVFWHIFHLRWFQDLGIPKLVVVFTQAAPHKQ